MRWYQRQQDAGQIIEVFYGYGYDNYGYKKVVDRSDGSIALYKGELDWDREPEGSDNERAPAVKAWGPWDGKERY